MSSTVTSSTTAVAYASLVWSPSLESTYMWMASVRPDRKSASFPPGICATVPAV